MKNFAKLKLLSPFPELPKKSQWKFRRLEIEILVDSVILSQTLGKLLAWKKKTGVIVDVGFLYDDSMYLKMAWLMWIIMNRIFIYYTTQN